MDFSCRVCIQVREPMVHIYEEDLCAMLESCGGLVCSPSDSYSNYLCKECTSELLIAAKFREKCERSLQISNCVAELNDEPVEFVVATETTPALSETEPFEVLIDLINDEMGTPNTGQVEIDETVQMQNAAATPLQTKNAFECDVCGANFVQFTNLRRHVEKSHKPAEMYACEICGHCFVSKSECDRHCRDICGEQLAKPATSAEAMPATSGHSGGNTKRHVCSHCGKVLQSPFALNMHLRTHTGDRPFACSMCEKKFRTQSSLTTHLKRHAGMPDYYCNVCDKRFYESSNLKAHMKTHTGDKPHSCKVCGQSFSRVFLLQIHVRTHTGEKPYKCEQCERAFAQACDLANHRKTHSGEHKHHCPVCERSFIKRHALRVHMQQHEGQVAMGATCYGGDDDTINANEEYLFL